MMTQRLSEGIQHKLLIKLLEHDYSIEYKKGRENRVADALSRKDHSINAISSVAPAWITDVEAGYLDDTFYTTIIEQLLVNEHAVPNYSLHSGILRYKGRICIGTNSDLQTKILSSLHSSALGGHSGIRATYQRIKRIFHWPKMKKSVETFVFECPVCQRTKAEHCHYPGLLLSQYLKWHGLSFQWISLKGSLNLVEKM
jgi:hypothetical protein